MSSRQNETDSGVPAGRQLDYRPELFLHALLLVGATAVLLMSFLMKSAGQNAVYLPGSIVPMPEVCTSRIFLNVDCPGCGLTRSFIAISKTDFRNAWHFNPAGFIVYLLVVAQVPWQILQMRRIFSGRPPIEALWVYALPVIAGLALVIQWLFKTLG